MIEKETIKFYIYNIDGQEIEIEISRKEAFGILRHLAEELE